MEGSGQVTKPDQAHTALITGASTGIGRELAFLFAKDGFDLVLVSRNKGTLEKLVGELPPPQGKQHRTLAMDLSVPGEAERLYRATEAEGVRIDVLVNNAGYGAYGAFHEVSLKNTMNMVELNVNALTALTWLFLEPMIGRKYGRIMNVASVAAFSPGPYMAAYFATKAYVLSLTESLAFELRDTGVAVSALCPGPTKTEFGNRASRVGSRQYIGGNYHSMSAKKVARIGYRALMNGKPVCLPGVPNKFMANLGRFFPRSLVRFAVGTYLKRRMK